MALIIPAATFIFEAVGSSIHTGTENKNAPIMGRFYFMAERVSA